MDRGNLFPTVPFHVDVDGRVFSCHCTSIPLHRPVFLLQVSCVSPSPTQISPSEAATAFQDPHLHLGNALLNLELYNTEAFAKQLGPFVVSANSLVFVEVKRTRNMQELALDAAVTRQNLVPK